MGEGGTEKSAGVSSHLNPASPLSYILWAPHVWLKRLLIIVLFLSILLMSKNDTAAESSYDE